MCHAREPLDSSLKTDEMRGEVNVEQMKSDDWRLMGQEKYLTGASLSHRRYRPRSPEWDHDHCEFCGAKFSADPSIEALRTGYTTKDEYRWICETCFGDFKARFSWSAL